MQNPPEEVKIGSSNVKNTDLFNDMVPLNNHPQPHKIWKITVQFNNEHVKGIKIVYKDAKGKEIKGESSVRFRPLRTLLTSLQKSSMEIQDNDYIQEIYGYTDHYINQIGFKTYNGHKRSFGTGKGAFFSYQIPLHTFTAAHGAYSKFLEFLAFRVVKLPNSFIQSHRLDQDQTSLSITTHNTSGVIPMVLPMQQPMQQPNRQYPVDDRAYQSLPNQPQYNPNAPPYNPNQYVPPPPPTMYPNQQVPPPQPFYPNQQQIISPPPPPGYYPNQQVPPPPQQQPMQSYYPSPQTSAPNQYPMQQQQQQQQPQKIVIVQQQQPQPQKVVIVEQVQQQPPRQQNNGMGLAIMGGIATGLALGEITDHHHHHRHHHHHHGRRF